MHPLDSSLDASLHGHRGSGEGRQARRRTSLDNGYLASTDLMMLASSNANGLEKYNSHLNEYCQRPRRLSLNNCTAMNTTFLTSVNYNVSTATKNDLDRDFHSWLDESSYAMTKSSSHSRISKANSLDLSKKGAATAQAVVSDIDGTSSSGDGGSQCDSFCEATGAEPANREYMMQDLGASCFWDDDAFFEQVECFNEMSAEGLDYNNDEECEVANESETSASSEQPETTIILTEIIDQFDDDSSQCDSFCDADNNDRANTEYLATDMGMSCVWNSNDVVMMDCIDGNPPPDEKEKLNASFRTITEEISRLGEI